MSYSALVAKTWDQAILSSVLLELTYRCNLDCVICYNDRLQQGVLLEEADYLRLLEDLAALQVLNLVLSGGEPLAHPDFWRIGRCARELGFLVRIKSNGHALGPALARRLRDEVAPFMIDLSLHGACAATHDRQTRIPGSFARLMDNLRTLQDLGLRLKLNSPLTAWNEAEIEEMFALADELGLRLSVDTRLTPRDDGDVGPLELSASVEGIRKVLRLSERRRIAMAGIRGTLPMQRRKPNPATTVARVHQRWPLILMAMCFRACSGASRLAICTTAGLLTCGRDRKR